MAASWDQQHRAYPIPRNACYMAGAGNQKTFVILFHDLVVVRLGHYKGSSPSDECLRIALTLLMAAVPENWSRLRCAAPVQERPSHIEQLDEYLSVPAAMRIGARRTRSKNQSQMAWLERFWGPQTADCWREQEVPTGICRQLLATSCREPYASRPGTAKTIQTARPAILTAPAATKRR